MNLLTPQIHEIMNFCHLTALIEKESGNKFDNWKPLVNFAIGAVYQNIEDLAKAVPYPVKGTPLADTLPKVAAKAKSKAKVAARKRAK